MWGGMFDEQLEDMLSSQWKLFPDPAFLKISGVEADVFARMADSMLMVSDPIIASNVLLAFFFNVLSSNAYRKDC